MERADWLQFKIIVVEPKYQINIGYIARVSMNFGIKKLYFVRPRAKLTGKKAVMFAKHARALLKSAKIYNSIADATSDCSIVIGTTGIWQKAHRTFKRTVLLQNSGKSLRRLKKDAVVGILIGRDDIWLTADEIEACDMVAFIGTNEKYPVLNVSHALSIVLYELTRQKFSLDYQNMSNRKTKKRELEYLFRIFDKSLEKKRMRDKKAVSRIFRRIINYSQPNGTETHALITALKE